MSKDKLNVLIFDANVLASWIERTIYSYLHDTQDVIMHWSESVEQDLVRTALPSMGKTPQEISEIMDDLHTTAPDGMVVPTAGDYSYASQLSNFPDRDDVAVVAGAIAVKADIIVTKNTSHFTKEVEQRFGIRVAHSSDMLLATYHNSPETMVKILNRLAPSVKIDLHQHFASADLHGALPILEDDRICGSDDLLIQSLESGYDDQLLTIEELSPDPQPSTGWVKPHMRSGRPVRGHFRKPGN